MLRARCFARWFANRHGPAMRASSSNPDRVQQLDVARLDAWMARHVAHYAGPLAAVEKFSGGQSNPTFKLIAGSGSYVLRRKPPGLLLASAHAVDREFRVLSSLARTNLPVPRVHALCTDTDVIGSMFY